MLANITAPYSAVESLFFDALIAPAIAELGAAIRAQLLSELPRGGSVLDVGCGGGHLAVAAVAEREDARITGLDPSRDQIRRAKKRGRGRISLARGSALDLPFRGACFDMVVSIGALKHWPDQARGLAECARVLRPGGALAVVEADRGCREEDVRAFVGRWRIPGIFRPGSRLVFRSFIAGRSIDLDEARALLARLPLTTKEARRLEGMPALILQGRRA